MRNESITAIPGILAGHATDGENRTGCTVVLCPGGATPGVAMPGFASGSRETELLKAESLIDAVHGIVLSGGSAFGLASADGVVRWLREKGHGLVMPHGVIPLVSGAVLYDLDMNRRAGFLPDADMGYAAAAAASGGPLEQGAVGAGAGARCGRLFHQFDGADRSAKSGLGTALVDRHGILAGAVVAVNAMGNVHDPETGVFLEGGRRADGSALTGDDVYRALAGDPMPESNTVLAVVAVNVPLSKVQANRLARMAAAGLPRAIRPAHLPYDGDVVFALSPRPARPVPGPWSESLLGAMGADAVARAAANAVIFTRNNGKPRHLMI